ncbi:MAG: hypothetical protein IPK62_00920 [Bacteroidetes bacterium]|nr:hypothetical protein [Bacteroidota bacterium]
MVLLALSIIIIPQYYITGDGGSHVYNAKVLFDYVLNHERDFYKEFFVINRSIDPNWMSHLSIGFFLQMLPPWLADKLFQILYVITFAFGFRYFIKSIEKNNGFLSFLFFPFFIYPSFSARILQLLLCLGHNVFYHWFLYSCKRRLRQFSSSANPFATCIDDRLLSWYACNLCNGYHLSYLDYRALLFLFSNQLEKDFVLIVSTNCCNATFNLYDTVIYGKKRFWHRATYLDKI